MPQISGGLGVFGESYYDAAGGSLSKRDGTSYVFKGFPGLMHGCGDLIAQMAIVIDLWNQLSRFPV